MSTLEFPAYTAATHRITLRKPEMFNTDAVKGLMQTMVMSDGGFRTYVKTIRGRLFDFTFNLYCKTNSGTFTGMLGVVEFFEIYNGNYLKYIDEKNRKWTLQLLEKEITMDQISREHWQFSLSGLRFEGSEDSGSGGTYNPTLGVILH